ncbi:MAG TPA: 4Fe-4S dicluster domain-containing protein [Bacteroidota bacterium]|jgi:formate dehydrogenase iron-sulfur subunit|nr:4Fe-4S dicluster domain-containing protein [Bacteroidota bacterium]
MRKSKALLIDTTLCIGCNACQEACKKEFNLREGEEKKLSPTAYTALEEHDGIFVRRMCQHCVEPTCVSVCPVGAFTKTPEGPVLYDESKCIGCRYCIQACPFQVPRYEWNSTHPRVQKCRLCVDRLKQGLQPACSEACPTGATKFGDRDDLIREAYERIKSEPQKYVDRIYGKEEVGGTSVLYLSSVPFEQLGFKTTLENVALPMYTWNALSKIPSVVGVGSVFLYGIWWITNRRMELQKSNHTNNHQQRNSEARS